MSASVIPRTIRWFVYLFLAAFIICGTAAIEAWPLTGWRLFSHVRARHQLSWDVEAVDPTRQEHPLPFDRFPVAYRGFTHILDGFATRTPSQQIDTCRVWINQAASIGVAVQVLNVYRINVDEGLRSGDRAFPGTQILAYTCTTSDVTPRAGASPGGAPE